MTKSDLDPTTVPSAGDTGIAGAGAPARAPYPESRWSLWARSFGMLCLGGAGLVASITTINVQRSARDIQRSVADIQRSSSLNEIAFRQQTMEQQASAEMNRLAASLIPYLKCKTDQQQTVALRLLSTAAVTHAALYAEALRDKCPSLSLESRREIDRAEERARTGKRHGDFVRLIANAREYYGRGHYGQAAEIFAQAARDVPPPLKSSVPANDLAAARDALKQRSFQEAADRFAGAFQAIPSAE